MGETYFQNFTRDNGKPVTVEYGYSPGSDTTYSPMYGAVGGDGCDIQIVTSWPNTGGYNRLFSFRTRLELDPRPTWQRPFAAVALAFVDVTIWIWERWTCLTDAERERMEAWLAEHHVYEPYEEDYA